MDSQYLKQPFNLNERAHLYGEKVHLFSNPYLLTRLAFLSSPECRQPGFNRNLRAIYRELGISLLNTVFARDAQNIETRMGANHPEGVFSGELLSNNTEVVLVSLARAGMVPCFELFDLFSEVLSPERIRVDHVFISRQTDDQDHVTGASIAGSKIAGPIDGKIVIIPDPMGATGSSMVQAHDLYRREVKGEPACQIALNLMVTPEYIRHVTQQTKDLQIYSVRLDRGFSSKRALESVPGTYPEEESGLNDQQYIVPGGGGFGELMNNAWV